MHVTSFARALSVKNVIDWLDDKIVDAANLIVASHLTLAAPQTSLLFQSPRGFRPVRADETTMQIMYDWAHWLTPACVNGKVFVANSAGNNCQISPTVARQLKQLYAACTRDDGTLEVNLIACTQQPNASDCGVFATAYLFEWATASVHTSLTVRFDLSKMRSHLVTCLEAKRVLPFPRLPVTRRGKCAEIMKVRI